MASAEPSGESSYSSSNHDKCFCFLFIAHGGGVRGLDPAAPTGDEVVARMIARR